MSLLHGQRFANKHKNELTTNLHTDVFKEREDEKITPNKTEVDFSLVLSVLSGRVCVSGYTFQPGT